MGLSMMTTPALPSLPLSLMMDLVPGLDPTLLLSLMVEHRLSPTPPMMSMDMLLMLVMRVSLHILRPLLLLSHPLLLPSPLLLSQDLLLLLPELLLLLPGPNSLLLSLPSLSLDLLSPLPPQLSLSLGLPLLFLPLLLCPDLLCLLLPHWLSQDLSLDEFENSPMCLIYVYLSEDILNNNRK